MASQLNTVYQPGDHKISVVPTMSVNPSTNQSIVQNQPVSMGGGGRGSVMPMSNLQSVRNTMNGPAQTPWMEFPGNVGGCPPGLEYLASVDQILCHQQIEMLEAFVNVECSNRYSILNNQNQQIYFAYEESGYCMRQCCTNKRSFVMHIQDQNNEEVMRINRPFKCCAGCKCCCFECCCLACLGFCSDEITVELPSGEILAYIDQSCSLCGYNYKVKDANGETRVKISGPCCCKLCWPECCGAVFNLYYPQNSDVEIGQIQRYFTGMAREMFTQADNFGVSFPQDMDPKIKAGLIGATFLIDFMAYEGAGRKQGVYR